jgi:2-polyprenyl-3-methyl-5-hydroxy-6-metoxy-1,4-benzoquinol methylase
MTQVFMNHYGFYEVVEKPSPEELQKFYAETYYQTAQGSYEKAYSDPEKEYFRAKIKQKHIAAQPHFTKPEDRPPRFLDVGCGEGWSLAYFEGNGWECVGLDYSEFGCKSHNPTVVGNLLTGDIYANVAAMVEAGTRFDLILLDNVLEHVIDPGALLRDLRKLVTQKGALIVEVPNDFSPLHQHLLDRGHIDTPFWVMAPEHLSYFGPQGLTALSEDSGWKVRGLMTDYPIDLSLVNPRTNYVKDHSVGKACHLARVEIENLLHSISPEKTVALYSAFAALGIGRGLTAILNCE